MTASFYGSLNNIPEGKSLKWEYLSVGYVLYKQAIDGLCVLCWLIGCVFLHSMLRPLAQKPAITKLKILIIF